MMFYPDRMSSVDIIVENSRLDALLSDLHRHGIMEISDVQNTGKKYLSLVRKSSSPSELREISSMLLRAEEMLADFELAEESRVERIKDMIFPKVPEKIPVTRKGLEGVKREGEEIFTAVEEKAEGIAGKIEALIEKTGRKRAQLENVQKMLGMNIDLSLLGRGGYVVARAGEVGSIETLEKEVSKLSTAYADSKLFFKKKEIERYAVIAMCYIRDEDALNSALRKAGFQDFDTEGLNGRPEDADRALRNEILNLEKELGTLKKDMRELSRKWKKRLEALAEELEIMRDRLDVISSLGKTESVHVISGWVPEKKSAELEKLVKSATDNHALLFFDKPKEEEDVPVKMANPKWAKPFEFLTKMFAPPKYNEIDPTVIIAPIFIIYFGLMLGDALYGVIITLGGWIIYRGMGRVDEATKHFGIVTTLAGISTVIFGIMQGGYLGPFSDQAPNLFQLVGISVPSLLDSMKDPITMLVIGLLIGLAHINLGLILGVARNIKEGKKREALFAQGTWWVLQPAGFILISGKLFKWFDYSGNTYLISWVLLLIGLVMLIIQEKGLSFFGITGFIGNFLSYARILALGLGTAGIALTVNMLTSLVVGAASQSLMPVCASLAVLGAIFGIVALKKPRKRYKILGAFLLVFGLVGVISVQAAFMLVGALMFVMGHIANTGLQAMGSFVHSLRLQYVEFFGYFYEGGGREFQPYEEKRKVTEVKEVYK